MAKEIVWTKTAIRDRFKIYQYWADRNKSNSFSDKLEVLFNETVKLLSEFPEIGTQTDATGIRVKVVRAISYFILTHPTASTFLEFGIPDKTLKNYHWNN